MIDTDSSLLAERVGQLETEKKQLIAENQKLKEERDAIQRSENFWRVSSKAKDFMPDLPAVMIFVAVLVIIGAVWKNTTSSNTPASCYIQGWAASSGGNRFGLFADVEWGHNYTIGTFDSLDAAIESAGKLKCPLNPP